MTIPILVEPMNGRYRASTGAPLDMTAEAATAAEAIATLNSEIVGRLAHGGFVVHLPVPGATSATHGPNLAENPLFDEWLQHVDEARSVTVGDPSIPTTL